MTRVSSTMPRFKGSWMLLIVAALSLNGCTFLQSNEWIWLWAVTPLAAIAILGGTLVHWRRKKQLSQWDLAKQPDEPSVMPILAWLGGIALALLVAFALYNLFLRAILEPVQLALNIASWLIGTIIGATLAFVVGLKLAEPPKSAVDPT